MERIIKYMKADKSRYVKITKLLIFYIVLFYGLIVTNKLFYSSSKQYPKESVLGFTYPPAIPDFSAQAGGVKTLGNVTAQVSENAYSYDTYFWVNPRSKTTPVFVSGYFQISDMYDVWMRKQADSSKIVNSDKTWILSFLYDENWLFTESGILFPESSIKIAYATTYNGPWTLENSVINSTQNTVATITKKGGFYMLVAGFGVIPTNTPTPTLTPSPTLTPTITPTPTVTPYPTITTIPTLIPSSTPIPTVTPDNAPTIITPTQITKKIIYAQATRRQKDIFDTIIDAILSLFGLH